MLNSPYLDIPLRKSTTLSLSNAVKQYISSKYDQHPDMFASDLTTIDQLRTGAVNVQEPHVSGIQKLSQYAAHLQWISGKFPIDIGADFTWYPSLGYNTATPIKQNNLQFERANVLFNLAALYAKLANQSPRNDASGLKTACNYYMAAAGTFQYIKSTVLPELRSAPPEDMDAMTLACLEQLMLAQAQECFWLKAVKDGNKDSLIARLAASVSDYYDQAAEFGTQSPSITSEWLHHMNAKHHHFAAAAQYRASEDCLNRSKYGEQVSRLQEALSAANDALKEHGRYLNATVKEDLMGLKEKVTDVLKGAEKDNDLIYLEPVPPASALSRLQRASMVKAKVPNEVELGPSLISESGAFGPPLFAKLVPFAVTVAASIYVERRDRLVNETIVGELDALTGKLHELMQSLNLPGSLQALEKPLGLPPAIVSHADDVRQQGGIERLYASIADIDKLKSNDVTMFREAVEMLKSEATEDEQLRLRHGTARWTRLRSQDAAAALSAKITEYENILKSADESDQLVRRKLETSESILRLLSGGINVIEDFVPNSARATLTPKVDREVAKLRACLNEVSRLESRRRRRIEAIRQKAKSDDITASILVDTARLEREQPTRSVETADFEPLFNSRLEARYNTDQSIVEAETEEQEQLVAHLQEANTSFLSSRRVDSSLRQREEALQKLENGYLRFKELLGNLDVGRKFYNDLAKLLSRFRDECKSFVYQRRVEAGQLEVDIATSMHNLRLSTPDQEGMPPREDQEQQYYYHHQQGKQLQNHHAALAPQSLDQIPALQPQRQGSTPMQVPKPGLWQGDATTAIRFAPPGPK